MIFGPTASGKSGLAIVLAKQLNGIIINADSRQIYAETPILTACPTAEDYAAVPHDLYEVLPITERFSAAEYALKASQGIEKTVQAGKTPIVVGGTGFYIKALLGGLSEIPATDPEIEAELTLMTPEQRFNALKEADAPTAARLHANDTQRVLRALVVCKQTGKPLSEWQRGGGKSAFEAFKIGLNPPREVVHANIALRRREIMPNQGLLGEVKRLVDKGYAGEEPGLKGLANALLLQHVREGCPSWEEVTQKAIEADRQYAKRQYTWLKNSYGADMMLDEPNLTDTQMRAVLAFLQR